jgi:hypothetical protein
MQRLSFSRSPPAEFRYRNTLGPIIKPASLDVTFAWDLGASSPYAEELGFCLVETTQVPSLQLVQSRYSNTVNYDFIGILRGSRAQNSRNNSSVSRRLLQKAWLAGNVSTQQPLSPRPETMHVSTWDEKSRTNYSGLGLPRQG